MRIRRDKINRFSASIEKLNELRRRGSHGIDEDTLIDAEQAFCAVADLKGKKLHRCGWPDFLVEDEFGTAMGVEVKTGNDMVRPSQAKMFKALERAGISVMVWRPETPGLLQPWRRYAKDDEEPTATPKRSREGARQPVPGRVKTR